MTLLVAAVLIIVIVMRRFYPVAASALSLVLVLGVGAWGLLTFNKGGSVLFLNRPLTPVVFTTVVALWFALESAALIQAIKRQLRAGAQQP